MQGELTLDEMLADPIVHLVMDRHGVAESEIRQLVARLKATYARSLGHNNAVADRALAGRS